MKLYRELAVYYDEIYQFKNYEKEARKIRSLITKYKESNENKLLDVACGTGNHITFLKRAFSVQGIDSSADMLRVARRKHPDAVFHYGDMTDFKLHQQFDVVTCLFSAIGHVRTRRRMERAVRNMADHLRPGGVLIIEPWIRLRNFKKGGIGARFVNKPDLKIARMDISKVKGPFSNFEYHYLIGTPEKIRYVMDKESMGLWSHAEYMNAFKRSRLMTRFDRGGLIGRGLYIGLKSLDN